MRIAAEDVVQPFLDRLDDWLLTWETEGFGPLRSGWLARAAGLGEALTVQMPDGELCHGRFRDIDEQGALVVQTEEGRTRKVTAGAIFPALDR